MTQTTHTLDPHDNVAVALTDQGSVPRGHKVAVVDIPAGAPVVKYGHVIGRARTDIEAGEHVHTHNLEFVPLAPGETQGSESVQVDAPVLPERRTFAGIRRSDGSVATRNYIAVVSSVNCSATVCRAIAVRAEASGLLDEFAAIDGVVPVTHGMGCGHAGENEGLRLLRRTLAGYAAHPNVGGVVIVGLGCEMNQVAGLLDEVRGPGSAVFVPLSELVEGPAVSGGNGLRPDVPVAHLTIQEAGGTAAAIERGLAAIREMAPQVADVHREDVSIAELVLGLECGGSDAWSGVTANPALGWASDLIVAQGGRSVLAETPEIYGAEDLLLRRAVSPEVAEALVERLRWWERYTAADGASMDNNPSPGNKAGGLTTILEKSLGAVAKGGHAPLQAVYGFAEPIRARGFSFMDTPGYDPVSVTGLIAGGCTLVAFTTGRGSAFGSRPAPTLKLATNSEMYRRMSGDMDIDCGDIIERGVSLADKGLEIYHALLDIASGTPTASERLGYGFDEFVPWHLGALT